MLVAIGAPIAPNNLINIIVDFLFALHNYIYFLMLYILAVFLFLGHFGLNFLLLRFQLDDYYYRNWNFWLDVTLLVKTVRIVIHGSGAK